LACRTKEEAQTLLEEEVANLVVDEIRYAETPEILARLATLFGVAEDEERMSA
jgi:hypothetical protein